MSKSRIKLQPISVRNPLPTGKIIPSLPLPHQDLITAKHSGRETSDKSAGRTGYTGTTDTGDDLSSDRLYKRDSAGIDTDRAQVRVAFPELPPYIEGKARDVWKFLAEKADFERQEKGKGLFVRATRREIARGAGIGSMDTVDRSLARLQGLGFIDIERSRGVNDGSVIQIKSPEQHPASEEKAWEEIARVLEQSAGLIRKKGRSLSPSQLIQWSHLADRAFRLVNSGKGSDR